MAQELEISSEFLNTLEKADKKLKKLNETTDQLESTFSSLVNGGLTAFSQKLGEITNAIGNISKAKIGDLGIEKVTKDATKAADAVNTVSQAVSKMGDSAKFTPVAELKQWAKAIKDEISTNTKLTPKEHQSLVDELYKTEAQIKAQMVSTEQAQIKASQEIQKQEQKKRKAIQDTTKALEAQQKSFEASVRRAESRNNKRDALIARQSAIRNEAALNTYSGAMNYSQSVTTIAQQTTAIQHLKKAREDLDRSSFKSNAEYRYAVQQLNKEIRRQQKEVDKLTGSYKQQSRALGELGMAATTVFSVRALLNYGKQIVQTTGEFEMMNKSLQVLLQDKRKADLLWDKTIALAQKSPFTIKQLLTSTKQLAAYRVESEKLYEVNSMLSDISAGLGVEMNRLVLAYGQVKAANFLRGTELRQFSEAGVNMLEELSKYFTEVEGRAVSVGEVFEMVSKRQVSFEDVDEVLHRITSEGGIFYKMQEEQAKTIQGMIRNLQDAMDVMKNEIGSNSSGLIKGTLSLIVTMVKNWRIMGTVLKMIGTYLLLNKMATKGWGAEAKSLSGYFSSAKRELGSMLKNFGQFLKNNKGNLIATAIVGAVTGIVSYVRKLNEVNEAYQKQNEEALIALDNVTKLKDEYDNIAESIANTTVNSDEYNKLLDEESAIIDKLIQQYPELEKYRKEGLVSNEDLFGIAGAQEQIRANMASDYQASFWHDSLKTNVAEFDEEYGEFESARQNSALLAKQLNQDEKFIKSLSESEKQYWDEKYEILTSQKTSDEEFYRTAQLMLSTLGTLGKGTDTRKKLNSRLQDVWNAVSNFWGYGYISTLVDLENTFDRGVSNLLAVAETDAYKTLSQRDSEEAAKFLGQNVDTILKDLSNGSDVALKQFRLWAQEYFANQPIPIDINFEYNIADNVEKQLGPQMQLVYDALAELNNELIPQLGELANKPQYQIPLPKPEESEDEFKKRMQDFYSMVTQEIVKGQLILSDAQVKAFEAAQQYVNEAMAIVNIAPKQPKGSGGSQKNTFDARLRVLKDLNKEYKELTKHYSAVKAKEIAIDKFGPAFSEAFKGTNKTIDDFAWNTEQGIIDALDWLATFGRQADRIKAKHARAEFVWEVEIKKKQENNKAISESIQDLFDEYQLAQEIKDISIEVGIPLGVLDVSIRDVGTLKSEAAKAIVGDEGKGDLSLFNDAIANRNAIVDNFGQELYDAYVELLKKLDEAQRKSDEQFVKDLTKSIRGAYGEQERLFTEYFQNVARIATLEGTTESKAALLAEVKKKFKQDLSDMEIDAFRSSQGFINMFSNLESASEEAINTMIQELEALLKNNAAEMTITEIKEMTDKINDLRAAAIKLKDPFEEANRLMFEDVEAKDGNAGYTSIASWMAKFMTDDISDYYKEVNNRLATLYREELTLESTKEQADALLNLTDAELSNVDFTALGDAFQNIVNDDTKNNFDKIRESIKGVSDETEESIVTNNKDIITLEGQKQAVDDYVASLQIQADIYKQLGDQIGGVFHALTDLNTALGGEWKLGEVMSQSLGDMTSLVANAISAHNTFKAMDVTAGGFGKTLNTIASAANWVMMAIQLAITLINAISSYRQDKFNKAIESHQKKAEQLEKSYSKLEKSMDEAYDVQRIQRLNAEMENNLKLQIAEAKAAQAAAEAAYAAKGNDENESKVEETTEAVEAATEALEDFLNTKNESYSGGVFDDVISDAEAFVDAWLGAFEDTGDGLSGLEEQFQDTLKNIVKRQVALQFVGNYVKGWSDTLDSMFSSDGELTPEEISDYADKVKQEFPELSEMLEEFFKALGSTLDGTGSLSGFEKGIQGVTEDTASVIASFLNSLRFYVADTNSRVANIERFVGNNKETNPMLAQLQVIAAQTSAIHTLLKGVTSSTGQYIRVELKES